MPIEAAFCILEARSHAELILGCLRSAGFANHQISVVFWRPHDGEAMAWDGNGEGQCIWEEPFFSDAEDDAISPVVGFPTLNCSEEGDTMASGPIVRVLRNGRPGAAINRLADALADCGIPTNDAGRYERCIAGGGILVLIQSEDDRRTDLARRIFEAANALEVGSTIKVFGRSPIFEHRNP